MNKAFVSIVAVALLSVLAGCTHKSDTDSMNMKNDGSMKMDTTQPATQASSMIYTCTMHSDVVSDKPGKCPKCGMDLVAKK
jgi:hypothetical protein